ncbi:sensor histidine kinase [Microbacterium sp. YY-01]|uniref:sensor histidine kinase n=1 Tax=Microbacterium sp. YY-01 TaxID=3421634 RepID=UPI003D170C33
MAAEASIRQAWQQVVSPGDIERQLEQFAGRRMERIMAIVICFGAAALGTQALIAALGSLTRPTPAHIVMMVLAFVPLLAMIVMCILGRDIRIIAGAFTVSFLMVVAWWPWVAHRELDGAAEQPWIFFLVNVAGVAGIIAFGIPVQILIAVACPLAYGCVRLAQGEFTRSYWMTTAFDVSFTLILGFLLLALGWTFRSIAAGVDRARTNAVHEYAEAASAAAVEKERLAVAALMHDSVLAALIAAERAQSQRERELAVAMAREALTRLANAENSQGREGSDEPITVAQLVADLRGFVAGLAAEASVVDQFGSGVVPERVARAVDLAARQAIDNAVMHAQGRGLRVIVEGHGPTGLTVKVSDSGDGFDPDAVDADRLGIRGSIVARMAAVGGVATVESSPRGTVVTLGWSAQ